MEFKEWLLNEARGRGFDKTKENRIIDLYTDPNAEQNARDQNITLLQYMAKVTGFAIQTIKNALARNNGGIVPKDPIPPAIANNRTEVIKRKSDAIIRRNAEHPEDSEKRSVSMSKRYEDPEAREKTRQSQFKRYEDPEEIEKTRQSQFKRFENPEEIERLVIARQKWWDEHPEQREIASVRSKELIASKDQETRARMIAAMIHRKKRMRKLA